MQLTNIKFLYVWLFSIRCNVLLFLNFVIIAPKFVLTTETMHWQYAIGEETGMMPDYDKGLEPKQEVSL